MATTTVNYATKATITIGLATTPLATSSTFVLGRESNEIDNTTNKYLDALVQGKVTVGTSPTSSTQIQVWVYGSDTSLATSPLDVLDGADSDETMTSGGIRDAVLKQGAIIAVDSTTSNRTYFVGSFSVANLFGGTMPKYWGLFVTHNTGTALNSTASNHEFTFTGIKYDIA